ncbi:MAG: hypothetical protein KAX49_07115 [Halanaerobiales bacterium]|nr:hypothetical protein [Halanaerobiales bacterium]
MKNRRSILELTSLLDVILILLFAFMLNFNADLESVSDEKLMLESEMQNLVQEKDQLISEKMLLQKEIEMLKLQMQEMEFYLNKEKQTLTTVTDGLARFMQIHHNELELLLQQAEVSDQPKLQEVLDKLTDETQIIKELWKHETLVKRFFSIEVGLKSSHNLLFVNGISTNIGIDYEEIDTIFGHQKKKEVIKDAIEQVIKEREGGAQMVALSLALLDQEVYQYAYSLTWEAIKEIQEKYGTDKIFISEYIL